MTCVSPCYDLHDVPAGSPSRGGDVAVYVFDITPKLTELAHSFSFCSYALSVFMTLSTVLYSMNSPDNSPLSHSVPPVLSLPD